MMSSALNVETQIANMVKQDPRFLTSSNRYRIPIPLEPLKDGPSMDPKERTFLEAAERGDKHTMIRCLQPPNPVNVNCTNILGRSAIQIAVDNENVEIVELLLQQENVKIGDALLYAIREGVYKIVEMLINHPSITSEMLANDWAKTRQPGEESSDYCPDISPVILAAHCNQFEILQLLLSRGATIDNPHPLSCGCQKCQEGMHTDSLRYSLRRIHTYRALASPAWMSLTSEDPILTAFRLSWELEHLAQRENEFKEIYLELSNQCKKYSCDLLDLCRSTEEVIAVLNKKTDSDSEDENEEDPEKLTLSRLKLALKYEQKQFVAHPNCQQLLTSIWYEGLPVWRRRNCVMKILLCCGLIACMPVIALYYLIFPRSKLGKVIRSPFMKFIYHSASFGFFLLLLVLASTRTEGTERTLQNIRGPSPSFVEWLIFFWVTGMVWAECKQLWEEGLKAYVRQWWNWLDFIMLSLYLATFSLKAVAYFQIQSEKYGPRVLERPRWPDNDPTLIAEGVFAVANVFSFARIIYLFQTNPHLGPLQISLGCMIIDIAKFLFIFFLVLTSFACGLNQLYWYYDSSTKHCETKVIKGENVTLNCQSNPDSFMTIGNTFATLFWSLFGISSPKSTDLVEDDVFIETVGQGLFMSYHVTAIVVLVNMLIAMMTKSFQVIEDHADREWKFARSKLWMGYFDEGCTLPPPFNIIISPKSIFYFLKGTKRLLMLLCPSSKSWFGRKSFDKANIKPETINPMYLGDIVTSKPPNQNGTTPHLGNSITSSKIIYQEVMKRLVSRYIHQTKKQLRQDGVNEDDLLEIKQDISSLRYELREDRKREAARNTGQIDGIKRDIIRSLRGNQVWTGQIPPPPPIPPPVCHSPNLPPSELPSPGSAGFLSPHELDYLKRDIIASVREELRNMMRELQQHLRPPSAASLGPTAPPPMNSELYHTHLYTEL
ncbi:transient-receptor-potential-like protein isoform X1 [Centruroides sculpturatus]|uniref:transient-receptor-potential-like protein isoform X1 n=1 Tax=Centruroides sculpturatus TaxID=218467 RepID=UPI000C6CBEE1|nr:transient-receptor-potential-like protein isoform X1 [Centruroides sculpturatus]XP_023238516.1 transient-receptor-potential-like protein isoform X1 [Centruroides sculpturatus]